MSRRPPRGQAAAARWPHPRTRRAPAALGLLVALAVSLTAPFEAPIRAAVALTAVAPLGASAGVNVQITGTGFDPVAANNTITLTPQGGVAVNLVAESITVLDATKGLRRIGITVPAGLPVGNTAILVRNRTTNETAGGKTLQIVQVALPQTTTAIRGATSVPVRVDGSSNVQFVAGRTTPTFGAGVTVTSTQVLSATSLVATVSVSPSAVLGPRTVSIVTSTQTMQAAAGFTIIAPNRPPAITSTAVTSAVEGKPYAYQVTATDPDGDPVSYRLVTAPAGMTIAAGLIAWTPAAAHGGTQSVVVEAMDGRGGTAQQSFQISVTSIPQLQAIDLQPSLLRFSTVDTTRALSVAGLRTNGTTVDLTSPASGTIYESSNAFVARVAADGTVTGVANGTTTITARNSGLSDTTSVVVEAGVTLEALELTPGSSTLRTAGATQALLLRGRFSDGSTRDLTASAGATFESSNPAIAAVAASGVVTAIATGSIAVTARYDTRSAAAGINVSISSGNGFLRGEAYDDSKGLPLGQVVVSLLSDGGGALTPPVDVVSDDRGQFVIAGRAGDALVRITKAGYSAVERSANIPAGSSATLFDARLTPLDPLATLVSSAVGGQARNQSGRATLQIPPGGVTTDQSISLTLLSPQGLGALLPAGWSPVAAVNVAAGDIAFGFPLTFTVTNTATLPQNTSLTVARYDTASHDWMAVGTATIDAGGLTLRTTLERDGQFALLAPDAAPFTPADPTPGARLTGVERPANQATGVTAVGEVVPRSAPPGDEARALGRVGVTPPGPAPSGTFIQARVSERFDLFDQTQVVTQPFTQDLVSYAMPRPSVGGALGAAFPITPSRNFTIQELMLGVVRLDVTAFAGADAAAVIGSGGGTVTSAEGDVLQVPPGALAGNVPVALRRLTAGDAGITVPVGFDLIAAIHIDLIGVTLTTPAQLSAAGGGSTAQDQILVARAFNDPFGQRRLKLVAVGELAGGRLVTRTTFGALTLAGVRTGGEFVYLRAQQPTGFFVGTITRAGATVIPGVLVTSDSVGVADVTGADGRYLVAGRTGVDTAVRALEPTSRDSASAVLRLDTPGQIVTANLSLAVVGPTVAAVTPTAGAAGVALDTSVTIDFSEALDPASVSAANVVLQLAGSAIAADRIVSADARRVVLRPSSPLTSLSTYTLQLTAGLRDVSGNPLTGYTPVSFTTLDPSRPAGPAPGRIVAELPDETGFVLITGAPGVAAGGAAVTVINLRTQETATVLALADGSFRLRISAVVGDELNLILRGTDGRDTTIAITQFVGADGSITVGAAGGTIRGPGDRTGTILPRALAAPGTFRIDTEDAASLPLLPGGFTYADSFSLSVLDASFKTLASLTLSESQNRFAPATSLTSPFTTAAELTTPPDALVNSTLRFTAVVSDADGVRRTVGASTTIVAGTPNGAAAESSHASDFPTLFVAAPHEALPLQQVAVSAVAPAARIDLESPLPAGVQPTDTLLLAQQVTTSQGPRLAVLDHFSLVSAAGGSPRVRTTGRAFPGMTTGGHYAIIATHDQLVFVTGVISGAQATVMADGLPFVFTTGGPNGRFIVPVRANAAFTLRFYDANGSVRGTTSGQASTVGTKDVGDPLGSTAGLLTVSGDPNERSVVDIDASVVLRFSEPIDASTISAAIVVTDDTGSRVFGRLVTSEDGTSVSFTPLRRWRYGTRYRYGVATSALARSGARLRAPFSSQFTTFQPLVVGSLALSDARDVAVTGGTAVVATATGITTVDVASPRAPRVIAETAIAGGANGVTILSGAPITDRNGQSHSGPIALVAAGGPSAAGFLKTFDMATPSSPAALGSTQLTNASGQTPAAGVPSFVGTPHAIATGPDGLAFVAIDGVGASSVQIGQAIPVDATTPARGAGARYPSPGAESASDVARLGERLLVAGVAGLTVLDAATMHRVGGVSTTGNAQGLAALPAFRMDVNGDGVIASATEVFDLAVVANGIDGTLQFYRVPSTGDPVLLSAVRFSGAETADVQVDGTERLAYVALGSRGLAIVDLDGPASVQPIDVDRNGIDDRVLGSVGSSGPSTRIALDSSRGVGLLSDGPKGLTVLQLLPARIRLVTLSRDPLIGRQGDEQSILESRSAFVTDEAVVAEIDAILPVEETVVVSLSEAPAAGGIRVLTLGDGAQAVNLHSGRNRIAVRVAGGSTGATAALVATDLQGRPALNITFSLVPAQTQGHVLERLLLAPDPAILMADTASLQLSAGGQYSDGRVLNLTPGAEGTHYETMNPAVATVSPDGMLTAISGGSTEILVSNGTVRYELAVQVQRAATLAALTPAVAPLTLTATSVATDSQILGRFTDDTLRNAAEIAGTGYLSSNPSIVSVDARGFLVAHANGFATLTASNGTLSTDLAVYVELREPTTVTGIDLRSVATPTYTDDQALQATAVVSGSGSMYGLSVTIAIQSPVAASDHAVTGFDGVATVDLPAITTPRTVTLVASVADPSTGTVFTDTEFVTVLARSRDAEPNDTVTAAAQVSEHRTVDGALTSGSDARDIYSFEVSVAGTLRASLALDGQTVPSALRLVIRTDAGVEIATFQPSSSAESFQTPVSSGRLLVSVELTGTAATASYQLSLAVDPGPLTVTSVQPSAGDRGTLVRIIGSGFSPRADDSLVIFGGVEGRPISASGTTLDIVVPANAVDGPIRVLSLGREGTGPVFITGHAGPPPAGTIAPSVDANYRRDPADGRILDITRLKVQFAPSTTREQVQQIADSLGGTIVGFIPRGNMFWLRFAGNQNFARLFELEQMLSATPGVLAVDTIERIPRSSSSLDLRDASGRWPRSNGSRPGSRLRSAAYEQILLFEAIGAIRRTSAFRDATSFKSVQLAIIDTGFNPKLAGEFSPDGTCSGPRSVIRRHRQLVGGVMADAPCHDVDGHGTEVAGIIGALNDGSAFSGIFGSLFTEAELETALSKLKITAYQCDKGETLDSDCIDLAFDDIAVERFDIVNMSFGSNRATPAQAARSRSWYRSQMASSSTRTLFVASAGNEGLVATRHFPSALSTEASHVISVGAVATQNIDGTGEVWDARALYDTTERKPGKGLSNCDDKQPVDGSNCIAVDIAAPGDEVFTTTIRPRDYIDFGGTSAAAPMVSGVALVLQAIRPDPTPLTPTRLKEILMETGDELAGVWKPGYVRRLNALAAVRRLLPLRPGHAVWVAHTPSTGGPSRNVLVGFRADPLDIDVNPVAVNEIPLIADRDGTRVEGTVVSTMKSSSVDGRLYVLSQTASPLGDGIFVVNTASERVEDFIPLSGAAFPANPSDSSPPAAAHVPGGRLGMAFSIDSRLLFVSTGPGIVIVNTLSGKVVKQLEDLPGSLRAEAPLYSDDYLATRLTGIAQRATQLAGVGARIRDLALSPDGRTLYALVSSGAGSGSQPGVVLPIEVGLVDDLNTASFQVEPHLAFFMSPSLEAFRMTTPTNDEPSAVAVSSDGHHLYVTNGGLDSFTSVVDASQQQIGQLAFASVQGTSIQTETTQFQVVEQQIAADIKEGKTFLLAPGYTGVFSLPPTSAGVGPQSWHFPSEIVFGWNPSTDRLVSQSHNAEVYAKRPFGLAMRPDGRRALVPFFQTGNFGVFDLDRQRSLTSPALPENAPFFASLVAVTPALELDPHLIPKRGATDTTPSPDMNLLFPGPIVYSQNGRFAAAVHAGAMTPAPYQVGNEIEIRGGGALTLIDDRAISFDYDTHAGLEVQDSGHSKFFYADRPLCRVHNTDATCQDSVLTSFTSYRKSGGASVTFEHPTSVAIDPILMIEAPASGSNVRLSTSINLSWNDSRVLRAVFTVSDLGTLEAPILPAPRLVESPLTSEHRSRQTFSIAFGRLFPSDPPPLNKHRYRVKADLLDGVGNLIGSGSVDPVFFQ